MFSAIFEAQPKDDKRDVYMGYANSSDTETTMNADLCEK
jgi:hypothetical protein